MKSMIGSSGCAQPATEAVAEDTMKAKEFPNRMFVSICGSGHDACFGASKDEVDAIKNTDDEVTALVGEYKLINIRKRTIVTIVKDA